MLDIGFRVTPFRNQVGLMRENTLLCGRTCPPFGPPHKEPVGTAARYVNPYRPLWHPTMTCHMVALDPVVLVMSEPRPTFASSLGHV